MSKSRNERRQQAVAQGKCPNCLARELEPGFKTCARCRERNRETYKFWPSRQVPRQRRHLINRDPPLPQPVKPSVNVWDTLVLVDLEAALAEAERDMELVC